MKQRGWDGGMRGGREGGGGMLGSTRGGLEEWAGGEVGKGGRVVVGGGKGEGDSCPARWPNCRNHRVAAPLPGVPLLLARASGRVLGERGWQAGGRAGPATPSKKAAKQQPFHRS